MCGSRPPRAAATPPRHNLGTSVSVLPDRAVCPADDVFAPTDTSPPYLQFWASGQSGRPHPSRPPRCCVRASRSPPHLCSSGACGQNDTSCEICDFSNAPPCLPSFSHRHIWHCISTAMRKECKGHVRRYCACSRDLLLYRASICECAAPPFPPACPRCSCCLCFSLLTFLLTREGKGRLIPSCTPSSSEGQKQFGRKVPFGRHSAEPAAPAQGAPLRPSP